MFFVESVKENGGHEGWENAAGLPIEEKIQLGWETGIEPATFGATDRRSTS